MNRGVFISFEGSEGCGKSTQIALLAAELRTLGREVEVLREPGGTALGERVRHLLQFAPEGRGMCPESELLLFTASRAQLVRERIRPALARGAVVLCDRFLDSTTVYQGVARRLAPDSVAFINDFAVGGCLPDVTFLLDLDPVEACRRMAARNKPDAPADRMEQESDVFYEAVRAGYLHLAQACPSRVRRLDGARSQQEIQAEILEILSGMSHAIFSPSSGAERQSS